MIARAYLVNYAGTAGIAGAADTIMVLKRGRLAQTAILSLTGRDVEEAEYALSRDNHGWKMEGTAEEFNISQDKKQIIDFLKEHDKAKPKEIAEALGKKAATVRVTLTRMLSEGKIHQSEKGVYCL